MSNSTGLSVQFLILHKHRQTWNNTVFSIKILCMCDRPILGMHLLLKNKNLNKFNTFIILWKLNYSVLQYCNRKLPFLVLNLCFPETFWRNEIAKKKPNLMAYQWRTVSNIQQWIKLRNIAEKELCLTKAMYRWLRLIRHTLNSVLRLIRTNSLWWIKTHSIDLLC